MDHIEMEVDQEDVNVNGTQLSSNVLRTRVVLSKILENFASKELRELSLVSRLWHSEARRLMEKRGTGIASISPKLTCESLMALVYDLQRMTAAPISLCGIKISVGSCMCDGCQPPFLETPEPNYDVILDRLKWRNLSVELGRYWSGAHRSCPPCVLTEQIFLKKCKDLVEIDLMIYDNEAGLFIEQAIQNCSFPRLQTLHIHTAPYSWSEQVELNFFRAFLARAPALQKVYASETLFGENLLDGRSVVLVPSYDFNPYPSYEPSFFCETIVPAIRLESLILEIFEPALDWVTFNRVIPVLLKNSCNTLESVQMDLLATLPLMNYGISLVRVRKLEISMSDGFMENYQPEILKLIKEFNFTRVFPNLSKVQIISHRRMRTISAGLADKFVEQARATGWEHTSDRALRIKHLEIMGVGLLESATAQFFAHMFPNVQNLSITRYSAAKVPFGINREQWANLQEISFG